MACIYIADLIDGDSTPHMAAFPSLLLQGLGEALLGALLYALRVCERPPLLSVCTPHLHVQGCSQHSSSAYCRDLASLNMLQHFSVTHLTFPDALNRLAAWGGGHAGS